MRHFQLEEPDTFDDAYEAQVYYQFVIAKMLEEIQDELQGIRGAIEQGNG